MLALSLLPPSLTKTSSAPSLTPRAPKSCAAISAWKQAMVAVGSVVPRHSALTLASFQPVLP